MFMKQDVDNSQSVEVIFALSDILHSLQRERGCVAMFLDSRGEVFSQRLKDQVEITDAAIHHAEQIIGNVEKNHNFSGLSAVRLSDVKSRMKRLDTIRQQIFDMSIQYTQAINLYTFELNMPLLNAITAVAYEDKAHNSALVSAYDSFLQWKERIGQERALGSRGYYKQTFDNPEFCDRMMSLMAEQETYLKSFMAVASPLQLEIIQTVVDSSDMQAVRGVHQLLEQGKEKEASTSFTGETWFELMTRIIDKLKDAEVELVQGLTGLEQTTNQVIAASDCSEKSRLKPFLQSLSLFSSLSDQEVDELVSFAQVRDYEKGKLLFLQGEAASRFYIIMSGWVKVYNGLDTGEETILQMLSAGDTLLESAIFLSTPAPVSAQIVEDSVLVSIPAPVIRQRIQHNNRLAVGMLNNVSLRSQMLIYQIEQSRLKSAKERVGWFLLRLWLQQGRADKVIHLPYDKAIIASYLNMRPETFSRALKRLRTDGFEVFNDRIEAPKDTALCNFCDTVIAGDCPRAATDDCPHPEFGDFDPLYDV